MRSIARLRAFFRKEKLDADMSEEMREHLELQTAANVMAGMPLREAVRAARRQFGHLDSFQETARDQRGFVWLEQTRQDARYALRQLLKSPGFTAVVVLTLAIGIGGTTAIFSVVNTMILNPVADPDPERLVQIGQRDVFRNEERLFGITPPVWKALEAERDFFAGLAWCDTYRSFERQTEDFTVKESGALVPTDFFTLLNARPILGRTFAPGEAAPLPEGSLVPATDATIVLSHAWWQSHFGGDPQVLGRTIQMSERHFTVIGVMPPHFQFPTPETQFWVATEPYRSKPPGVRMPATQVIARLRPDTSPQQVQAMLDTLAKRLMTDDSVPRGYSSNWRLQPSGLALWVRPLGVALQDGRGAEVLRQTLFGLLAAIGFVLLIVCANVANLTLARVERRRHELAVRAALGASRGRLMRQLVIEHLLLALLGGAAGLVVTAWGIKLLVTSSNLPRLRPVEIDGHVLGITLAVSVATGLFFGLAPIWRGSRVQVNAALSESGATATGGRQRNRYRGALVIGQVAITVVLLTGAGLMLRSVVQLLRVDPGFEPANLLLVDTPLPWRKYEPANLAQGTQLKNALFAQLHERFASLPGVKAVGFLQSSGSAESYAIEGQTSPVVLQTLKCGVEESDPFRAMQIPLLDGRYFRRNDVERKSTVVINESMARLCWPNQRAVGKRFHVPSAPSDSSYEVIGVVGDTRINSYNEIVSPVFYRPYQEGMGMRFIGGPAPRFILRTSVDPRTLVTSVRRELKAAEPNLEMPRFAVAEQVLYDSTRAQRTYRNYLAAFAGVGLGLSALGIYGVLAYAVARRTREIGIRIALGANRSTVLALVMSEGARLIAIGVALGLVAAFWLTRFLRDQLFQVSPNDPLVLLAVVAVLVIIALIACWLPARRAAKVDPMVALRTE